MRNENIGEARSVTANIRGDCDCRHEKAGPLRNFKINFLLARSPNGPAAGMVKLELCGRNRVFWQKQF